MMRYLDNWSFAVRMLKVKWKGMALGSGVGQSEKWIIGMGGFTRPRERGMP